MAVKVIIPWAVLFPRWQRTCNPYGSIQRLLREFKEEFGYSLHRKRFAKFGNTIVYYIECETDAEAVQFQLQYL